jgi:predicted enzyme related to lactoylglutathione lyase
MSTHDTPWPAGTPCWVELASSDARAAGTYYGDLFGWDVETSGPEFGHYGVARVEGRRVAGIGSKQDASVVTAWTTYLASDDATATADAVTQAGGQIAFGPMQVGDLGSMAIAADPTGAIFGIWQAGSNTGAALVNQPGGVIWNEHVSGDLAGAKEFYAAVFGLQAKPIDGVPDSVPTAMLARDGDQVVGSIADHTAASAPSDGTAAAWLTYFAVADTEATAARATELGGSVLHGPFDAAFGRSALLAGPEGERFAVVQTPPDGYGHSDAPDDAS